MTRPSVRGRRAVGLLGALIVMPLWAGLAATPDAAAHGRQNERTTWDSVFSATQAGRGETTYKQLCARCHMETLAGGDEAGELTGSAFMSSWNGQTLAELHERIRTTMPTDTPGVYTSQQVTDVIAYMLRFNGFPPGSVELTHTNDALKSIRFVTTKP
ncbi:c-type cytochrome [Gemmatimonas groenlandica]|uniref:Cytochrome c n=1 Tax=Gemmatimonas groenlandica TaxID=2732249 RepID=A0A6M4IQT0_9BACT|nr:cytochrome c [Gemmatimonas groenlandica]QJR35817.1 cytochrome c [Gemmatimonas groenlandica]